ncbi:MAG: hypothetical protein JRH11_03930, partial [Deltaproteobacteria bacterium]|nr:hypothetical protein [Deltaproteobacteria bacterium]
MMEKKLSPVAWIAAGCGLLMVLGTCCGAGTAVYFTSNVPVSEPFGSGGPIPNVGGGGPIPDMGGGGPVPLQPPQARPANPRPQKASYTVNATVLITTGPPGVSFGDACSVTLEVRPAPANPDGYWCKVTATCADVVVYGGQENNGFVPCGITDSPLQASVEDGETTAIDTDGAFRLDTAQGHLHIRDDARGALGAFDIE